MQNFSLQWAKNRFRESKLCVRRERQQALVNAVGLIIAFPLSKQSIANIFLSHPCSSMRVCVNHQHEHTSFVVVVV